MCIVMNGESEAMPSSTFEIMSKKGNHRNLQECQFRECKQEKQTCKLYHR
jgi:hypothetical protein